MTTSLSDPRADFEINALGSLNVLEAVRKYCPGAFVVYSSTNKVYGDLERVKYQEGEKRYTAPDYPNGFAEDVPLSFSSPYGCSKGSSDQYMLDYYKMYGIKTAVLRHSSMYGGRQFATADQGWLGWFCSQALLAKTYSAEASKAKPFTISGNGKQVRDLLYADDMVSLYYTLAAKTETVKGHAFNIGGGMENSLSLLELFDFLEKELNVKLKYSQLPPRASDQKIFVADLSKIKEFTGWQPKINKETGIKKMLDWLKSK
jgi:CDP-paratose 2-epimerase